MAMAPSETGLEDCLWQWSRLSRGIPYRTHHTEHHEHRLQVFQTFPGRVFSGRGIQPSQSRRYPAGMVGPGIPSRLRHFLSSGRLRFAARRHERQLRGRRSSVDPSGGHRVHRTGCAGRHRSGGHRHNLFLVHGGAFLYRCEGRFLGEQPRFGGGPGRPLPGNRGATGLGSGKRLRSLAPIGIQPRLAIRSIRLLYVVVVCSQVIR